MRRIEDRIQSKEQFKKWVEQDRKLCGYNTPSSLKDKLKDWVAPNYIVSFLYLLRRVEYLTNCKSGLFWEVVLLLNRLRFRKLQVKLGFSIPINVFGPGLSIAHFGTIVVSQYASVGSNCRLHVGVNIGASGGGNDAPIIGNNVYIGPGAILFGGIKIADGISIGANATVNKSFEEKNVVIAGTPAKVVRQDALSWDKINLEKKQNKENNE